jgi:recombination protein RecT
MTTTVSSAVERRDSGPAELVRQSRAWFATIVPSHIDAAAFVALTIGYLRRNPKLAAAAARNPQSFMAALSECARLGLVPGDTFHCVPFGDEITGIIDYTGEIELIYRAGAVASVKAEIVYSRDSFHFTTDMDRPEHAPNWFGDRGDLIGAYAYAVMKDGATSKVVIYSKAEIDRVKAVSKTSGRADSPWNQWYDRMALKTVIHRLEHFVPTSAEYRREQLRAAAEVAQQVNAASIAGTPAPSGNGHPAAPEPDDIQEAEIVDEPSGPAAPDEPTAGTAPAAGPENHQPQPAGKTAVLKLDKLLGQLQLGPEDDVRALLEHLCGAEWKATRAQVQLVTGILADHLEACQGDPAEAASAVWAQYRAVHAQAGAEGSQEGEGDG